MGRPRAVPNSVHETLLKSVMPSGLTVWLNPKKGYCRTVGVLAAHFGSLDHEIQVGHETRRIPDGVAHFLEHKLFEDEEGDVSLRFSERGANSNAGTEFTKTSYHFSCVDRVEDNLETLLRFVLHPYFTDATVRKEQGIIEQEIRMYDDDPDWVSFNSLMQALYHRHPVRINIAGSVESIREITPELLFRCHEFFYHPANLVLAVSGGFDPDAAWDRIERVTAGLSTPAGERHRRQILDEPDSVANPRVERSFAIVRPQVCIGFKDTPLRGSPDEILRREVETQMLIDLLFSSSSPYHRELYESGIIDDSFEAAHSGEPEFAFSIIGGETDDPDRFVASVCEIIRKSIQDGLDEQGVRRIRNRWLGGFVRGFNSAEAIAGALVTAELRAITLDDMLDVMSSASRFRLEERLRNHLQESRSAVCLMRPSAPLK